MLGAHLLAESIRRNGRRQVFALVCVVREECISALALQTAWNSVSDRSQASSQSQRLPLVDWVMASARQHFQHCVAPPKRLVTLARDDVRPALFRLVKAENDVGARARALNPQMMARYS